MEVYTRELISPFDMGASCVKWLVLSYVWARHEALEISVDFGDRRARLPAGKNVPTDCKPAQTERPLVT